MAGSCIKYNPLIHYQLNLEEAWADTYTGDSHCTDEEDFVRVSVELLSVADVKLPAAAALRSVGSYISLGYCVQNNMPHEAVPYDLGNIYQRYKDLQG